MKKNFEDYLSEKTAIVVYKVQISEEGIKVLKEAADEEKREYLKVLIVRIVGLIDHGFDINQLADDPTIEDIGLDSIDIVELEIQLEELFSIKRETLQLEKKDKLSVVITKMLHNL